MLIPVDSAGHWYLIRCGGSHCSNNGTEELVQIIGHCTTFPSLKWKSVAAFKKNSSICESCLLTDEVVQKVKQRLLLRWLGCGCFGLLTAMTGMVFRKFVDSSRRLSWNFFKLGTDIYLD